MRYRELEDGTRVYRGGMRYTPVPDDRRKYARRRPDDPAAVRYGNKWFLPLEVLPDEERRMPDTRPDSDAYDHMRERGLCRCDVCRRPESERWKDRARLEKAAERRSRIRQMRSESSIRSSS